MSERGPIFLAGIDRSGIGLLGELLESHPNISMSRRTNFWSFYFNRFGNLDRSDNFERCLAAMMRHTRIQKMRPQPERIRQEFLTGEQTYSRLFAMFEEHYMQHLGKSRWGDKSLNSERYADIILSAYPTAKMIHIIRDPRDRYASQLDHRGVGRGKLGAGVALWLWSVRLAERNARKYGNRYKIVRYETLVHEPESFLLDLCGFVGEEYSPAMLMLNEASGESGEPGPGGESIPRPIRTTSIGKFRNILSTRDIAFIQMCTRNQMARYAYQPDPLRLSWFSWLFFCCVEYPFKWANMLLWQPWAGFKEMLGRNPSARRLRPAN